MRSQFLVWLLAAMSSSIVYGQGVVPLPAYNVDPSQVSVSGFSSGGGMAIQLGVAYSSRIMGVGAFAAPPYDCLRADNVTPNNCLRTNTPDISGSRANIRRWSGHEIDSTDHLARQRIFIYVGAVDGLVSPTVVNQTRALYDPFVPPENIRYERSVQTSHLFPTDFYDPLKVSPACNNAFAVVLADCGFDGAGETLKWIYGQLTPRASVYPGGQLLAVDQMPFLSRSKGMDELGFLYVPKGCDRGEVCKLHVFLHGCVQSYFYLGEPRFANWSGHSRWAETNNIVLLFPQTYPDPDANPEGCWDYNGRYDEQFDQKGGGQTSAIMAMVARITSGFQGVIEYRHAEFDHYFVTGNADEIAKLDNGTFGGWARTGESFNTYPRDTAGTSNVCRFFSTAFNPKSSHFYTSDATECETVKQNPNWLFEDLVFAVALPDAAGNCAAATVPVYRLYNNGQGQAPNHRYTKSLATRAAMISQGWVPEGLGSLGMIGCVPG